VIALVMRWREEREKKVLQELTGELARQVSTDEHGVWAESHATYARATQHIHQMHSMPVSMMCA